MLRAWIEQLIDRYNKNIQSATNPTNIQRIAKKVRTSSSATGPTLNHENIAPLPINSIIFNPYYHPAFYSSYIPFSYGPTTHLIPITHVSYPQQEYHHRLFIPVHAQLPYEYTQVPIMSPTLINDHPKIKIPTNVPPHYVPSNNQGEIQDHDHAQDHDGFEQQHVTGLRPGDHAQIDQENYDEYGKPIPAIRDGKLIDNINTLPSSMSTAPHQIYESQEAEFLPSTNDITMSTTFVPMTVSDNPSTPEAFGGPVSQTPLDNEYRSSDKLSSTIKLVSLQPVTKEPYLMSTTVDLETTTGVETASAYENNQEDESSTIQGVDQLNEARESSDTTADISDTLILNVEKTPKTNNATQTPEATTILSSSLYSTTSSVPTPLQCTNNNCSTTKSTYIMTRSVETTNHQVSHKSPTRMEPIYSSTQPASINDEQTNAISSSTRPSLTSTSISEMKKYPLTSSLMSNNGTSEALTTLYPTFFQPSDKYNEHTLTILNNTTSTSRLQSLNFNITTTTELIETETRQAPLTTNNGQNSSNNVVQNLNMPITLNNENKYKYNTSAKTKNYNLSSGLNTIPNEYLVNRTQAITEKSDVLTNIKMDHYSPAIANETSSSLKPTVTTNKSFTVHKKTSFTTAPGDSTYRTSANNQDRHTSGTSSLTPQTLKGSDLWYSHLYTQTPPKKELNEEQIDFLLKKLIKLLRPEIEKQSITKDSISRFVTPKHADQEKLVYIILPWIRDTNKNVRNEEQTESTTGPLKTSDKI